MFSGLGNCLRMIDVNILLATSEAEAEQFSSLISGLAASFASASGDGHLLLSVSLPSSLSRLNDGYQLSELAK